MSRALAFEREEGVGDRDERDVVVPAAVGPALEVGQPALVHQPVLVGGHPQVQPAEPVSPT